MDMIDLLSIIGLPFRATSIQKLEATLSEQQKDKMADGSGFPSPFPLPSIVTKLLIFAEKG